MTLSLYVDADGSDLWACVDAHPGPRRQGPGPPAPTASCAGSWAGRRPDDVGLDHRRRRDRPRGSAPGRATTTSARRRGAQQGVDVVGDVVARGLGGLGPQVAHVHGAAGCAADGVAHARTHRGGQDAACTATRARARPGRRRRWPRPPRPARRRRRARAPTRAIPDRAGRTATWPRQPPAARRLGPQHHRVERGRQHPARRRVEAHQPAEPRRAATAKSPVVGASPAISRLPRAWPSSSPPTKRCSRAAARAGRSSVGHGATRQRRRSPGAGHAERAAQAAASSRRRRPRPRWPWCARRSGARRGGWRPGRGRRPPPRPGGRPGGRRSLVDVPVDHPDVVAVGARSRAATSSAIATDRWRPPVQPRAMVR